MVSQSNTSVNIAFCLAAMLVATSTTQAQLSTTPKRYRSANRKLGSSGGLEGGQQQQRKKTNLRSKDSRKLQTDHSDDLSMPALTESRFEISMPINTRLSPLSMPALKESEMSLSQFDMSMPLMEAGWDMSVPMVELPTNTHGDELGEAVSLGNGSGSGNTLILASFLAGISALIVGAVALFAKMRRVHGREAEEETPQRENHEMRDVAFSSQDEINDLAGKGAMRVVAFSSQDEINDLAGKGHEIILS